ncbi:MAG TPA: hypothetical protein VFZ73_07585 [Gemmatimonadaceae bacterium]
MPRRRPRASRLGLFSVAAFVGLLAGGSLWLDQRGELVTANVAGKRERIIVRYQPMGEWTRFYEVTAAFDLPDGGNSIATVRVPRKRYAALQAGDSIEVRYLPQFPILARTSDRSTAGAVRDVAAGFVRIPLVAWIAAGVLSLWIASRLGVVPVVAVGAAWATAAWLLFFTPPSRERPRPAETMAEVQRITPVNRAPRRTHNRRPGRFRFDRRLDLPYQVVELHLPNVRGDTVLAVDAVDSGSVTGLAHGAQVPVRLDPAAPRDAQLAGGTRRFTEANRYHFVGPVFGFVILSTLAASGYAWRHARRTIRHPQRMTHSGGQMIPHEGGA